MKNILSILILISVNCFSQKNIKPISTDSLYEAFGILLRIKADTAVYIDRIGKDHVSKGNGNPFYRKYCISSNTWSDTTRIASDSLDSRCVAGGMMDNDSGIIFYARYHTDGTRDLLIQRFDSNANFTSPIPFNWNGFVKYKGGFPFSKLIKGYSAHEYFLPMYQVNDTGVAKYRISLIHTTDCFNTYQDIVVYSGSTAYTEPFGANLSNGKMLIECRNNQAGTLTPFESTNHGLTWIRRNPCNLYWYIGGGSEMGDMIVNPDSSFDIIYECRDAEMISISKNNVISSANFGNSFPIYNEPEMYAHNKGAGSGGNTSLGYPSMIQIGSLRLVVYAKQFNLNRANLMWTIDDLITDPGCIPDAPVITVSGITTTAFRIDIKNYSDSQIQNIRWFQQDLCYDSLFTNFVTCKYRITTSGAYPAVLMKNIRMTGLWDLYSVLTTHTTYWLRIRAYNYKGYSETIKKIMTL